MLSLISNRSDRGPAHKRPHNLPPRRPPRAGWRQGPVPPPLAAAAVGTMQSKQLLLRRRDIAPSCQLRRLPRPRGRCFLEPKSPRAWAPKLRRCEVPPDSALARLSRACRPFTTLGAGQNIHRRCACAACLPPRAPPNKRSLDLARIALSCWPKGPKAKGGAAGDRRRVRPHSPPMI